MAIPMQKLGWMAGIIDFKGRVVYKNNKTRKTLQIVLIVETKEMAIIRGLSELTGTSPELQSAQVKPEFMRRSCHEHCPEAHIHVGDQDLVMPEIARWTITGAAMVVVLSSLLPFLRTDRGWTEAIESATNQTVFWGRGATAVRASLRRLQEIGWDMPILYSQALLEDDNEDEEE
jgi:hypothetical protein